MKNIMNLIHYAWQDMNSKIAIPTLGLAIACVSISDKASAADKLTETVGGTFDANSCSKPVWPQDALAAKQTGAVTLVLLIGSDGKVKQSKVNKSSGFPELDDAARVAIAKCTFTTGKIDGKPVPARLLFQYVWTLD